MPNEIVYTKSPNTTHFSGTAEVGFKAYDWTFITPGGTKSLTVKSLIMEPVEWDMSLKDVLGGDDSED